MPAAGTVLASFGSGILSCHFRLSPFFFQAAFYQYVLSFGGGKNPLPAPLFSGSSQLWTLCPKVGIRSSFNLRPLRLGRYGIIHPFWLGAPGAPTFQPAAWLSRQRYEGLDYSLQSFHCQGEFRLVRTPRRQETHLLNLFPFSRI